MSIFIIKIIACLTMCVDHIKYAIPILSNPTTKFIGRISFPLFAFLLSEGYVNTSDLKKYYKRLIVFGIISQIPFMLFRTLVGEWKLLNIMFTLLLGLIAITIYDKEPRNYISIPCVILMICFGEFLKVDYGGYGVGLVFLFYLFREKKVRLFLFYTIITICYFYIKKDVRNIDLNTCISFLSYMIPMILVLFYNGKLGKKTKYFYYIFYPTHMIIAYLISFIF